MPVRFHLFKTENTKDQCPYCGKEFDKKAEWDSEFHLEMHYKSIKCECGKDNFIKVEFHGSGHDTWDGKPSWKRKDKSFDSIVQKEHEDIAKEE